MKSGTSTSTFIVVNQFAGSPIETLVDENRKSMVLATGFLGGDLPGIISGTSGDDFMDGRGGDDFLFGNGGNDHMLGGTGNDRLDGGKGNDILDGGPGDDILTGGDGRDTFVFAPGSGNDVVTDFVHGQDRLDLRAFDTSFRDLKTEDGHGEHGQGHRAADDDRITMHVDGHDTVLEFAGGSVRITGNTHLHADDFLWTATGSSSVAQASAGTTNSSTTVPGGGRVEISSAFAGTVTFAGDTGTLQLDNSASFSGTVAGMAGQDTIDFASIDPAKVRHPSYSGDSSGGTLTVTDGTHAANIALLGNYMASVFVAGSDGHGGTSVVDPPALGGAQALVTPPHA